MSDIRKRVITGIFGSIGLYVAITYYALSLLVIAGCLFVAGKEFYFIVNQAVVKNLQKEVLGSMGGMPVAIWMIPVGLLFSTVSKYESVFIISGLISSTILCIAVRLYQYSAFCKSQKPKDPINTYAFTVLFIIMTDMLFNLFVNLPFCFTILMASHAQSTTLLFIWIFATFQSDNGALLFGRLFGTFHPFPHISPQKTIQGLIGAYVLCILSLYALVPFSGFWCIPALTLTDVIAIGLGCSTLAVIGDLTESFIKRVGGVKDSGSIFPGHGGLLDRMDSLVWVTPFIYYYSTTFLL